MPVWSVFGIAFFSGILMIPAVWNYFVGYAVGTAISVIGLYIAFILPVYLRLAQGRRWHEQRAWSLGRRYKWSTPSRSSGSRSITILFIFPLYKAVCPGRATSPGS